MRSIPVEWALFCGRRIGDVLCSVDGRHKAIVYANIKTALGADLEFSRVKEIVRDFYRAFGQNFIEIFLIPKVDREYLKRYITIEGSEHIEAGFKKGKGIIFLGVHEGSWEMYNIISANLGVAFNLLVREQGRYSRVVGLLNTYREQKGCKLIYRQNQTRRLIEALKNNESIGMSLDQGGKAGVRVSFFGKEASMASGAVRLALKYDCVIIPGFYARRNGPFSTITLDPPHELVRTGNIEEDVRENVQRLANVFERYIRQHPQEYLWRYKIWKYGGQRSVVILSDGKTGHLRQSQAVVRSLRDVYERRGMRLEELTVEMKFRTPFKRRLLSAETCLAGKYACQGCLACLRRNLTEESYQTLVRLKPDVVVSCGSAVAPVNFLLTKENYAKSVVVMRPSFLGTEKFDLVVIPRHDKPVRKAHVCMTDGALNLIDDDYLRDQTQRLIQFSGGGLSSAGSYVGLLLGGDTKYFHLGVDSVRSVIRQVKALAQEAGLFILATTSRRTSPELEAAVRQELQGDPRCKLLIIANEKNIPEAIGGILGLSSIIVSSPESISMISEAASSGKYTVVFDGIGLRLKHRAFLDEFAAQRYIRLADPDDVGKVVRQLLYERPPAQVLNNRKTIAEALEKIL